MYNSNRGYVGYSRSKRSSEAIESFEMPISLISSSAISNFLTVSGYSDTEVDLLKSIPACIWKYVAKSCTRRSSWHHTSSFYNKTDHYDLEDIANYILQNNKTIKEDYKSSKVLKKSSFAYGWINVQVWGGSRKRPKLIGTEEAVGIVLGEWLYYKEKHNKLNTLKRLKCYANKVLAFETFDTYEELIQKHKNYKNTKRVFNNIIKEKGV